MKNGKRIKILFTLMILMNNIFTYESVYEVENCSPDNCGYPSLCISKTLCKCKEGFYNDDNSNTCNYKMKSNNTPFWVEVITNIGIGHMLIGNYNVGISKLVYIIFTLNFFYFVCMSEKNSKKYLTDNYHYILSIINLILCLGVFVWWIVDAICFGINKYKDSNGINLFNN